MGTRDNRSGSRCLAGQTTRPAGHKTRLRIFRQSLVYPTSLVNRPEKPPHRGPGSDWQAAGTALQAGRQHAQAVSENQLIAGLIVTARQLHPLLLDKGSQQPIHALHQFFFAVQLELAMRLNLGNAIFLDIACHYA